MRSNKKERSKQKFKKCKRKRDEYMNLHLYVVSGKEGWAFSMGLDEAGHPSQAYMGGDDPRCLQHPNRSTGPGAGTGRGCIT